MNIKLLTQWECYQIALITQHGWACHQNGPNKYYWTKPGKLHRNKSQEWDLEDAYWEEWSSKEHQDKSHA